MLKYLIKICTLTIFMVNVFASDAQNQQTDSLSLFKHNSFDIDTLFHKIKDTTIDLGLINKEFILFYVHSTNASSCNPGEKNAFYQAPLDSIIRNRFYPIEVTPKDKIFKNLSKKHLITTLPVIIICDTLMNEVHKYSGKFIPKELNRTIGNFVYKKMGLSLYKESYEKGNNDFIFLRDYTYLLRDANLLDSAMILRVMNKIPNGQLNNPDNIKFIQEFIYYRLHPFVPINHPIFEYYYNNQSTFRKFFTETQVKSTIIWIAINNASNACKVKNEKLFRESIKILEKEPYKNYTAYVNLQNDTIGRITSPDVALTLKMSFYQSSQNTKYLDMVLAQITKTYYNDWQSLNEFAWIVYQEKNKDTTLVNCAIDWIKQSIKLNRNNYNLDTYASLLFLKGELKGALDVANEALLLTNVNEQISTLSLIKRINQKLSEINSTKN